MLRNAPRTVVDGYSVSIKRLRVSGYVGNLAVVVQMYRQIMNVDAAFGVFELNSNCCLVIGRNLTDGIDGFLSGYEYLIHDRAPCFSESFRAILRDAGVKTIRLPRRSPNLNSHASYCASWVAFRKNEFGSQAKWTF